MIKWIRRSLGRKAVLFAVISISISAFGLFQFLFYASGEGYILAEMNRNQKCCEHFLDEMDKDRLRSVCEKTKAFYLSHDSFLETYRNDPGILEQEFRNEIVDDDYRQLLDQLVELVDKYGVFKSRFVLVDYKNGLMLSFMDSLVADDADILWSYCKENIRPSDNEYRFSDSLILGKNQSRFGRVLSVAYRLISDDPNQIRIYYFMDTDQEFSGFVVRVLLRDSVIGLVISSILMGIIILLLIDRQVVEPVNVLSGATRDLVKTLTSGSSDSHVFDDLDILLTGDEIEHLYESIRVMEDEIYSYMDRLKQATSEQERISTELYIAESIQKKMLPLAEPDFSDQTCFDLAASTHPAREIGGDFYDFFMLSEDRLCFLIADVSGKGVPAALVMAIGKTMLKNYTKETGNIGAAFRITNNLLQDSNETSMFITAFEAILDLRTGRMQYVNAGHEDIFLMKSGGEFALRKERHAVVLGAMEHMRYDVKTLTLEPGDRIYIYTDGVPEAQTHDEEMFGLDRTRDALNEARDLCAAELIKTVRDRIGDFTEGEPQFDDITMLCLDFRKYYE